MKKITLLLIALLALYGVSNAQTYSKSYSVNENFNGTITSPWGFVASGGTLTGSSATDGTLSNGGTNVYTLTHSNATITSTKTITGRPETVGGSDSIVYVEFKWYNGSQVSNSVSCGWLRFMNGTKEILTFMTGTYDGSSNSTLRLKNYSPTNDEVTAPYGITKMGVDAYKLSTTGTVATFFPRGIYMRVKARLNFNRSRIDTLYVVRLKTGGLDDTATGSYTGVNIPFLDATATQLDAIVLKQQRSATSTWAPKFEDFQIYSMKPVAGSANVTVNYIDESDGVTVVKSVVHANTPIDVYNASSDDKLTFTAGGYYCVYDASQTTSESVTVTADGLAHLDLKVKRFATTSGNYQWTGATSAIWNELNANFSTDGLNSLGFQTGNAVELPSSGANKSITLNDAVNFGTNNLTISSTGYSLGGAGNFNGTGQLNINLPSITDAVTLGVTNNLTGTTQISGGSVTVTKTGVLGTSVNLSGAAKLIIGATGLTIPATTFAVSDTIKTGTYLNTLISGMTAGNAVKISVVSGGNYGNADNTRAFDFAASGTLSTGSELELKGSGTDNRIGMTSASTSYLANTKVTLKGAAMLYINTAQGAATTINVGTLAGETGTKLGWGRTTDLTRTITWSVGSTDNSEYAGTITNTGGYSTQGSSYSGNQTNFIKVGTGTLTMSGAANTHNGSFVINGGVLRVTGAICNTTGATAGTTAADTVCVGTAGKLTGNGTVGGNTGVYGAGVLEGSLHFGGALKLTPGSAVNLVVNDFAAQHDSITVIGAATYDGTINVTVNAATPAYGTSVKLMYVGSYTGSFASINVPVGYQFDQSSGLLSYGFYTKLNDPSSRLSVYPTLSHGTIYINGSELVSAEVINIAGQAVKAVNLPNAKNALNLGDLSTGAYLVKIHFADGSIKSERILLQQ